MVFFKQEIAPIVIKQKKTRDLDRRRTKSLGDICLKKFPSLDRSFDPEGSVTAANASKINDGAAALFALLREPLLTKKNYQKKARIISYASFAQEPQWFTTAPAKAIEKALSKADMMARDIDLYEINEAF